MSASKYSYLGGRSDKALASDSLKGTSSGESQLIMALSLSPGFNGTSNVLAGKLLGIKISGTHAHAFVQSYVGLDNLKVSPLQMYLHYATFPLAYVPHTHTYTHTYTHT